MSEKKTVIEPLAPAVCSASVLFVIEQLRSYGWVPWSKLDTENEAMRLYGSYAASGGKWRLRREEATVKNSIVIESANGWGISECCNFPIVRAPDLDGWVCCECLRSVPPPNASGEARHEEAQ